jgi:outer membrane receptor for ferrienterochelin and colicins
MLCLALFSLMSYAQDKKGENLRTTIFKVHGACEQCKDRIENAIKVKGVKEGVWNVDTKMLTMVFDTTIISLEKIQNKILATGHDVEDKKAKDIIYKALPACCHYREMEEEPHSDSLMMLKGIVLQDNAKGKFEPLSNASVYWMGTNAGVVTDSLGVFEIKTNSSTQKLIISYTGYKADTITVIHANDLKVSWHQKVS